MVPAASSQWALAATTRPCTAAALDRASASSETARSDASAAALPSTTPATPITSHRRSSSHDEWRLVQAVCRRTPAQICARIARGDTRGCAALDTRLARVWVRGLPTRRSAGGWRGRRLAAGAPFVAQTPFAPRRSAPVGEPTSSTRRSHPVRRSRGPAAALGLHGERGAVGGLRHLALQAQRCAASDRPPRAARRARPWPWRLPAPCRSARAAARRRRAPPAAATPRG